MKTEEAAVPPLDRLEDLDDEMDDRVPLRKNDGGPWLDRRGCIDAILGIRGIETSVTSGGKVV